MALKWESKNGFNSNNSERPVDALAEKVSYSLTDNLKSRYASASKKECD